MLTSLRAPSLLWLAPLLALLTGCGAKESAGPPSASPDADASLRGAPSSDDSTGSSAAAPIADGGASPGRGRSHLPPAVIIETSLGDIRVQLDADKAPTTVDNFLRNYVDHDFYSQTIFHYVDQGFMIAGGGYAADLAAKDARADISNEADNGLPNVRGAVAMARDPQYIHSANSQFFINLADNPSLDHDPDGGDEGFGYCVFGHVVEGMDVVDKIAQVEVQDRENFPKCPVQPVLINAIRRAP